MLNTSAVQATASHVSCVFTQLEVEAASVKAIGELNAVLEWLESFHSKDHKFHHDDSK